MTMALVGGEGSASRPSRSLRRWKDPVPIVHEAGWAPVPVWTGVENLAPSRFDPRAVQPIANHYNDLSYPVTGFMLWFNLLNPTGYVMHQQFNIQQM
jgi:hypothetical protein